VSPHAALDGLITSPARAMQPRAAGAVSGSDWVPLVRDIRRVYTRRAPRVPPGFAPLPESLSSAALPKGAAPTLPVVNDHAMRTRAKSSFRMPARPFLHPALLSPISKTYCSALADPYRWAAMEEFSSLLNNSTWDLVPHSPQANVVSGKWIFKHKFRADGSLLSCTRPDGFFVVSLSALVLILMRI